MLCQVRHLQMLRNFDEAAESTEIAELNKRDKTFTAHIGILGFLENLRKGQSIIPAIPPIPGTEITSTKQTRLGRNLSALKNNGWVKYWKSFDETKQLMQK